tara:strand:- start:1080 stop:1541 length:462 start_codon:yes stop_codon:yes gene_type:complete
MIKVKFLQLSLIILLISNCGYAPLYTNVDNINFKINILKMNGVREINNIIKNNLESYSLKNSKKVFNISIESKYFKNIVTKDTTGAATEYKIIIETTYNIENENYNDELRYSESINMQAMSNKLDEKKYEETLRENLIKITTQKLVLQLSRIK